MIRLRGVSRRFQDGRRRVQALNHIDLDISAASIVALTGKSGSGKSTLLHLIGGLEWPSTGEITVAGSSLHRLTDHQLTRFRLLHIGFVFQFFHLLPALTVWENLLLPTELAALSQAEAKKRAAKALEAVDLNISPESFPDRLSGGEQQRVAIARSLMLEPRVLLADEPTGNLDSETSTKIVDLLLDLSPRFGTTVLLATHSGEIAERCGRRIELRDGTIVADTGGES